MGEISKSKLLDRYGIYYSVVLRTTAVYLRILMHKRNQPSNYLCRNGKKIGSIILLNIFQMGRSHVLSTTPGENALIL